MNSSHIASNSPSNNHNVESPKSDRADYATGIARRVFGKNYPADGFDGFVDRRPGELAVLRALHWSGTSR